MSPLQITRRVRLSSVTIGVNQINQRKLKETGCGKKKVGTVRCELTIHRRKLLYPSPPRSPSGLIAQSAEMKTVKQCCPGGDKEHDDTSGALLVPRCSISQKCCFVEKMFSAFNAPDDVVRRWSKGDRFNLSTKNFDRICASLPARGSRCPTLLNSTERDPRHAASKSLR